MPRYVKKTNDKDKTHYKGKTHYNKGGKKRRVKRTMRMW